MSIRLLAQHDPVIKERIKYTIGLICGHQKSTKFADSLAWQSGIEPGTLKKIDFRKKIPDAPSNQYGVELTGIIDGKESTVVRSMNQFLGHDWGQGFFKSNASDFTDDVMNETADITIGDAWLPQYSSDSMGNNVVLVRNEIIATILEEGIKSNKVKLDIISVDDIVNSQSSHFKHTREELGYRLLKKDLKGEWRPKKRTLASKNIPFMRKKVQDLREVIFQQSHVLYKEAVELEDLNYFVNNMEKLVKRYKKLYSLIFIFDKGPIWFIKSVPSKVIKRVKKRKKH